MINTTKVLLTTIIAFTLTGCASLTYNQYKDGKKDMFTKPDFTVEVKGKGDVDITFDKEGNPVSANIKSGKPLISLGDFTAFEND